MANWRCSKWQAKKHCEARRSDKGDHWEVRDKYSQPFFYIFVRLRPCLKNHLIQEKERYASF